MLAKKKEISKWNAIDIDADASKIGLDASPTKVVKTFVPTPRGRGEIFEGEVHEKAKELIKRLQEMKIF